VSDFNFSFYNRRRYNSAALPRSLWWFVPRMCVPFGG